MKQIFKLQILSIPLWISLTGCSVVEDPEGIQRQSLEPEPQELNEWFKEGNNNIENLNLKSLSVARAPTSFDMSFGMFRVNDMTEWEELDSDFEIDPANSATAWKVHNQSAVELTLEGWDEHHQILTLNAGELVNRVRISFECPENFHAQGLGAQSHDVDHVGQRVPLMVSEQGIGKRDDNDYDDLWFLRGRRNSTHIPMPVFVTNQGFALAVESYAFMVFDMCHTSHDTLDLEVWDSSFRLHLFKAESPQEQVQKISDWVGRPELPAAWMHLPWNDSVGGANATHALAEFLREEEISSSAIWSEDWRGGQNINGQYRLIWNWSFDDERYPNYPEFAQRLKRNGFAHQLYHNTFVAEGVDVYKELLDSNYLVQRDDGTDYLLDSPTGGFVPAGIIDLWNDAGVRWLKAELGETFDAGSLGWMADYGEWMPIHDVANLNAFEGTKRHNEYPVRWHQINDEARRAHENADTIIIYGRAGHLGVQKSMQVVWGGDQRTSFDEDDGLPTVIPIGLGLSATGFPYFTHDIAGYQSTTNAPATKELFWRWTELGAFTPVMRTHHGIDAGANWDLQSDAETTEHWQRYANLHARLFPTMRQLAQRSAEEGIPMWQSMAMLHPGDDEAWQLKDQFYLGDHIMVAPVVKEGATMRSLYLPSGRFLKIDFDNYANSSWFESGGEWFEVEAELGDCPVFLREGGAIALFEEAPMTTFIGTNIPNDLSAVEHSWEWLVAQVESNTPDSAYMRLPTYQGGEIELDFTNVRSNTRLNCVLGPGQNTIGCKDVVIDSIGAANSHRHQFKIF